MKVGVRVKIFIRADGGHGIGLGHAMRMLVLAKELSKNNKIIFVCRSSNFQNRLKRIKVNEFSDYNLENDKYKAGIQKIIENRFEVLIISEKHIIEDILNLQNEYKADLIITDSYDVDEEYFNKLKYSFRINGYMDDVNKCKMNVDFIINQNINAEDMNYKPNINENTKLFLGTKYCLLREEFIKDYKKKQVKERAEDVLLTLGGMDNDNNTMKILKEIAECNLNIHVAIGSAFDNKLKGEIKELSKKYTNIRSYENANMSALMKKCDIAISACGSTLYELCAINVPAIGIIIADNQQYAAEKMKKKSLIVETYHVHELEKVNIRDCLNKLADDMQLRNYIINNQCHVVNVQGSKNLAYAINKLEKSKTITSEDELGGKYE